MARGQTNKKTTKAGIAHQREQRIRRELGIYDSTETIVDRPRSLVKALNDQYAAALNQTRIPQANMQRTYGGLSRDRHTKESDDVLRELIKKDEAEKDDFWRDSPSLRREATQRLQEQFPEAGFTFKNVSNRVDEIQNDVLPGGSNYEECRHRRRARGAVLRQQFRDPNAKVKVSWKDARNVQKLIALWKTHPITDYPTPLKQGEAIAIAFGGGISGAAIRGRIDIMFKDGMLPA